MEEFSASLQGARGLLIRAAHAARELEEAGHPQDEGAASIDELAERHGLASGPEARMLARVGEAMARCPELERYLAALSTTFSHVADYLSILRDPELVRPEDQWFEWLRSESCRSFRRRVRRRVAEKKKRPVERTIYLTHQGDRDLERSRVLLSRKRKTTVTRGEAVEAATRELLRKLDPLEKKGRRRRKGDTAGDPGRYVPAEVQRELMQENGDVCIFRFCDHRIWLENAHLRPHRDGGSREKQNLRRPCHCHHTMMDEGYVSLSGPRDAPSFRNRHGQVISRPRPPPRD